MAKVYDLMLDEEGDLLIENGDFVIGESTQQNIGLILISEKGEWRHAPFVGAGLRSAIEDEAEPAELIQEIKKQLELDGLQNVQIDASSGAFRVEGNY